MTKGYRAAASAIAAFTRNLLGADPVGEAANIIAATNVPDGFMILELLMA
jgi:hypothetical protein